MPYWLFTWLHHTHTHTHTYFSCMWNYTKALFYTLVVFLKKWVSIKSKIPIRKKGLKKMEINHPNSIKLKMRGHKLERGVKAKKAQNKALVYILHSNHWISWTVLFTCNKDANICSQTVFSFCCSLQFNNSHNNKITVYKEMQKGDTIMYTLKQIDILCEWVLQGTNSYMELMFSVVHY